MYWYDTATEQSTSSSAGTDLSLLGITGIAGFRGYVRRLQCGPNTNATDVQVRIRLQPLHHITNCRNRHYPDASIAGYASR